MRSRVLLTAILWLGTAMATGRGLTVAREIKLLPERDSMPQSIARVADGGYLVVLDTFPPAVAKLDHLGATQWLFQKQASAQSDIKFSMAAPGRKGEVLVCASRKGGEMNRQDLPGLVIKLDTDGHQTKELDGGGDEPAGGPFYAILACGIWDDGYAIVANERRPPGTLDDFGRASSWPFRNVVIRLDSNLSVSWRKPLPLQLSSTPGNIAPKATPNNDLAVLGLDQMFILRMDGSIRAQTRVPVCRWVATVSFDSRIRLACARLSPPTSSTIFEYSESPPRVLSRTALGAEDFGVPAVCQLPDGGFGLLGNDGSKGPFLRLYDSHERATATHVFSPTDGEVGLGVDCVPNELSEVVIARAMAVKDHFVTAVTWLKTK
jgi:hypothetical protein